MLKRGYIVSLNVGISEEKKFVGLSNYQALFSGETLFFKAFNNTLVYTWVLLLLSIVIGLILALVLHESTKLNNFFRGLYFAPGVLATIAVGYMWKMGIYDPNMGLINTFLRKVGLEELAKTWISDSSTALISIVLIHVWMSMGFCMILFIAGINDIPESVYESAKIEGANSRQILFKITLPLLKPTMSTVILLTTINGFTAFDFVYSMTESGGAGGTTEVLATLLYKQAFAFSKVGISSAMAVMLLIIVLLIAFIQNVALNLKEE